MINGEIPKQSTKEWTRYISSEMPKKNKQIKNKLHA